MDQMDSLQQFELMFLRIKDGCAKCRICSRVVALREAPEVEFWKHQRDQNHCDAAISIALRNLRATNQANQEPQQKYSWFNLSKAKLLKGRGHDRFDQYLEEQADMVIQGLNQNGDSSLDIEAFYLIVDIMRLMVDREVASLDEKFLSEIFEEFQNVDQELLQMIAQRLGIKANLKKNQQIKQRKEYVKKDWSQEPFLQSYNLFFRSFIEDLIKEQKYIESSCFLLARLGLTANQMITVKIYQIPKILKKAQQNQASPETWIDLAFLQIITALKSDERYTQTNYLIQESKNVKELRKQLQVIRTKLSKNSNDQQFLAFLDSLRIKALNALFKTGQKRAILKEKEQLQQPDKENNDAQMQDQEKDLQESKKKLVQLDNISVAKNDNQPSQHVDKKQAQEDIPNKEQQRESEVQKEKEKEKEKEIGFVQSIPEKSQDFCKEGQNNNNQKPNAYDKKYWNPMRQSAKEKKKLENSKQSSNSEEVSSISSDQAAAQSVGDKLDQPK